MQLLKIVPFRLYFIVIIIILSGTFKTPTVAVWPVCVFCRDERRRSGLKQPSPCQAGQWEKKGGGCVGVSPRGTRRPPPAPRNVRGLRGAGAAPGAAPRLSERCLCVTFPFVYPAISLREGFSVTKIHPRMFKLEQMSGVDLVKNKRNTTQGKCKPNSEYFSLLKSLEMLVWSNSFCLRTPCPRGGSDSIIAAQQRGKRWV